MSAKYLKIEIAEICIGINVERKDTYLYLEKRFENFLSFKPINFTINYFKASKNLKIDPKTFKSLECEPQSFSLVKKEDKYNFIASCDESFKLGTIDLGEKNCQLYDIFPMWPGSFFTDFLLFCLYIYFGAKGSFMLHSCGLVSNGRAHIFFGPSGSGKSTVAKISKNKRILSDERLLIVKDGEGFKAYSMPWGISENRAAKIKSIFFLKKSKEISFRKIKKSIALTSIFQDASLRAIDSKINANILNSVGDLVDSVPCYEMYFSLKCPIWEKISELN